MFWRRKRLLEVDGMNFVEIAEKNLRANPENWSSCSPAINRMVIGNLEIALHYCFRFPTVVISIVGTNDKIYRLSISDFGFKEDHEKGPWDKEIIEAMAKLKIEIPDRRKAMLSHYEKLTKGN